METIYAYGEYVYSANKEYIVYMFSFIIFVLVALIYSATARYAIRVRDIKKRAHNPSIAQSRAVTSDPRLPRNAGTESVSSAFDRAAARFKPGENNTAASVIREDLIQAGFHDPSALSWYYFFRILTSIALPAMGFPLIVAAGLAQSTLITVVLLILLTSIGLIIPSLYVMRRKSKLTAEYRDGFPEFMDLLVVCSEAGIGLNAAIDRVTKEIAKTHRNLGVNLHIMTLEMRAGRPLTEAFESLAHRVKIDEVRSLGSLLHQSEELGTSLTEALRIYSKEMREKRFFRAEEKAYALPAKMVIPLGLFIFPVMLIVIMLPLLIRIQAGFFS